jgi:probable phosphoglycerate mutase
MYGSFRANRGAGRAKISSCGPAAIAVTGPEYREAVRLLLIRHAESRGNLELRLQGRREYPLTERGTTQAQALASRLSREDLAAVYSSPIGRAMETAEIIAAKSGLEVIPQADLQEYDFGEAVSGRTWDEIREQSPEIVEALRRDEAGFPCYPGEEGRTVFQERVRSALNQIKERHQDEQIVAIVTHAGPIAVMLLDALARPYARPIPFTLDNASITTIEVNNGAASHLPPMVVTGINDGCHISNAMSEDRAGGGA